ncbi:hypothetical protein ACETAC_03655 [Aceticella autotrophica]|uniref:Uncharacterized protein n=1 Tax=Aceticella autotrophica TaxID=2755338 RepID=A0A975AWX0_9THEO|nr:hypothetical protein [Aceticella autotrophica]QSZ27975.1 hypothetical protein ACETAC_03655 [Aceticella autotrophica]
MKTLKKISLWILFSFVLQFIILFYINNYFLTDSAMIQSKKILITDEMVDNIKVKVPPNANDIMPSFDGKYLSYILNNNLIIVNTKTSKTVKSIYIDGKNIDSYKWLNDRNRILYLNKEETKRGEELNIEAYDVDNEQQNTVNKTIYYQYKGYVSDITLSPLTNVIYINVSSKNNLEKDRLYQIDIMGEIKKIQLPVNKIIKMYETQKTDNLIYESSNNIVHIIKEGKKDNYISSEKYSLIGIDSNDNIYVGSLKNNFIQEVYYGTVDEPLKKWDKINLKSPVKPNNLILAPKNNKLYEIVNGKDLHDVRDNNIIYGQGDFIGINVNYIAYKKGDYVILKKY